MWEMIINRQWESFFDKSEFSVIEQISEQVLRPSTSVKLKTNLITQSLIFRDDKGRKTQLKAKMKRVFSTVFK